MKPLPVAVSDINLHDQERTLTGISRWESVQKKHLNYYFFIQTLFLCGLWLGKVTSLNLSFLSCFLFPKIIKIFSEGQGGFPPPIPMCWYSISVLISMKCSMISGCHGITQTDSTQPLMHSPTADGEEN